MFVFPFEQENYVVELEDAANEDDETYEEEWDGLDHFQYHDCIQEAVRNDWSSREVSRFINSLLKEINITDKKYYVNAKQVLTLRSKCGTSALNEHNAKIEHPYLAFDGKKTEAALPNSKTEKQHFITVSSSTGRYVDHFKSGEDAESMSSGVLDVIKQTQSVDSIMAIATGKNTLIEKYLFLWP